MRTCWEAGRVVISCTLAAVSERHNYVSLLEKMLKEVSQHQLLHYFFPSRGIGLALLPTTCTLLYFFQTILSIYHNQINEILQFPSCRTMFCTRLFPGENNPEQRRLRLVRLQLKRIFSKKLSSNGSSLAIFELLGLHCPSAVRPPWSWWALRS